MNPQYSHTDIVIPSGPLALESQAGLGRVGFVRTNEVQHNLLEQGEALGSVVLADHAVILSEADIEHPVKAVLDAPMRSHDAANSAAVSTLELMS